MISGEKADSLKTTIKDQAAQAKSAISYSAKELNKAKDDTMDKAGEKIDEAKKATASSAESIKAGANTAANSTVKTAEKIQQSAKETTTNLMGKMHIGDKK